MKKVFITGANKGIGFETARQLAHLGYCIYLGSRDRERGLNAIKKLNDMGVTNVELIEIDVADTNSVKKARQVLESKTTVLDILINNAAITGGSPQNISEVPIETLQKVFETNYFGVVRTTQEFLPLLKKSDSPVIVNVSSELGSLTMHSNWNNPSSGNYGVYSSSKTALNAFTVMMANELKNTNFKINSVSPGYTATDLNNHQGTQTVEQGAKFIVNFATIGPDGPTGGYFKAEPIPW